MKSLRRFHSPAAAILKPFLPSSIFLPSQSHIARAVRGSNRKTSSIQRRNIVIPAMSDSDGRPKATLVKPPPIDPSKSAIENVLELTSLAVIGPNIFTNTRPLWHPPGARGIYGGAVIAQCLAAAQLTVPHDFTVHSMHCYFVLAGDSEVPILFHVEDVRSGRSFATRTVQARQKGKCIFTTTMSFTRENSAGAKTLNHQVQLSKEILAGRPDDRHTIEGPEEGISPFEIAKHELHNANASDLSQKRSRAWMRARGQISPSGGHQAHISALAYMSDSQFIGTVSRAHNVWRWDTSSSKKNASDKSPDNQERDEANERTDEHGAPRNGRPELGMMVSLDHTIYFHEPRRFRADEWIFCDMWSPWAGDGRGLVMQHMFAGDGTLVATCIQEGVVRLKQDDPKPKL